MGMHIVQEKMLAKDFTYDPPWFYSNELSYRCELGKGKGFEYWKNARERLDAIYQTLFEKGADAFFFDHAVYDYDQDGKYTAGEVRNIVKNEKEVLQFVLECQQKFKHAIIRDIAFNKEENETMIRKNRIVCFTKSGFDGRAMLLKNMKHRKYPILNFVSYENECILTVYDDRGCDIVFYDKEKFKAFYMKLKPYFLAYDFKLMEERWKKCEDPETKPSV